jgi:hypothetical protein
MNRTPARGSLETGLSQRGGAPLLQPPRKDKKARILPKNRTESALLIPKTAAF